MKKLIFTLIIVIGTGSFSLFGQTINDDIKKLIQVSGSDKLAEQVMDAMIPQFQQLVPGIPEAFWVRVKNRINIDDLVDACIPVYRKYYTHDDIKQLIQFYESPLGKKMVAVTPAMTQETMIIGQNWGEQLGYDIVNELIREGFVD